MTCFCLRAVFPLLLAVLCTMNLFGQEKATITGTVSDPSGSVIPAAKVTVTNVGTGQTRIIETNSSGNYLVPDLNIGSYSVKVEATGFKTYEQTGIVLNVNDTIRTDVAMQVGEAKESVTVEASAVAVQSDSSEVSTNSSCREFMNSAENCRMTSQSFTTKPGARPQSCQILRP
jgi:hypothetical protein